MYFFSFTSNCRITSFSYTGRPRMARNRSMFATFFTIASINCTIVAIFATYSVMITTCFLITEIISTDRSIITIYRSISTSSYRITAINRTNVIVITIYRFIDTALIFVTIFSGACSVIITPIIRNFSENATFFTITAVQSTFVIVITGNRFMFTCFIARIRCTSIIIITIYRIMLTTIFSSQESTVQLS